MAIRFIDEKPKKKFSVKFTDEQPVAEDPTFLQQLRQGAELADPVNIARKAVELGQRGFDVAGEKATEFLAERQVDPRLAAGVGTAISVAPDIATTLAGGGGLNVGRKALGKALSTKAVGKQIGELERLAGITKRLPTKDRLAKELGLTGKQVFSDVANRVSDMIDSGLIKTVSNETLKGFRKAAKAALNKPEFVNKSGQFTEIGTDLLEVIKKADNVLNLRIAGRGELLKKFGKIKAVQKLGGKLKKGVRNLAIGGAGTALLLKVLGGR